MSALYTALLEGETKESLAAMVCELREAGRAMINDYRSDGCEDPKCSICRNSDLALSKMEKALKYEPPKQT